MMRYVTTLGAALIATTAFVGTADDAQAGCRRCSPPAPVYHYRTVNKVTNRTRYRDVRRTHYVHLTRRIYNITRVRPIVNVHTVTRVHHHSVPVVHNLSVSRVQTLAPIYNYTSSMRNYYHGCGC